MKDIISPEIKDGINLIETEIISNRITKGPMQHEKKECIPKVLLRKMFLAYNVYAE